MRKRVLIFAGILEALVVLLFLWGEPTYRVRGVIFGEAFYDGRPTSYWRQRIDRWMHQYPTREEALLALPEGFLVLVDVDILYSVDVSTVFNGLAQGTMVTYFPRAQPTLWDRITRQVRKSATHQRTCRPRRGGRERGGARRTGAG